MDSISRFEVKKLLKLYKSWSTWIQNCKSKSGSALRWAEIMTLSNYSDELVGCVRWLD